LPKRRLRTVLFVLRIIGPGIVVVPRHRKELSDVMMTDPRSSESEDGEVVLGVDTHLDFHVAEALTQEDKGVHRSEGAELVFVPSYSPDLNLIERACSKIKNVLRKLGAHPRSPAGGDGGGTR
jgi:hypothetical protein